MADPSGMSRPPLGDSWHRRRDNFGATDKDTCHSDKVAYASIMTPTNEDRHSNNELARRRAASRDLAPGMVVLVVSQMSLIVSDPDASAGGWHLAWALSPLIGIGLLIWAQSRILGRSDERERAAELSAMAIGFGVVITALAALGVLQAAEIGDIRQQLQITTVLGTASWVLASLLLKRRVS